jgi:type II secretory pathway pseudopilin PulG
MTGNLRDVRTQLLIVVAVLLLLGLAAIAVLVSPAGRSRSARQQQYEQLRLYKIEKTMEAAATQGMGQKIATAREQEADFNRERLVGRYSAMSEQLSHIAGEAGVSVSHVQYDEHSERTERSGRSDKETPPGYDGIGITIQVHGSYAQDIRFINAVERQKMLLLIDGVSFSGMHGEELSVSVHLSTFLRSAA